MRTRINDEYFAWIFDIVCGGLYPRSVSYRKLLEYLHGTRFRYSIPNDGNRAEDGLDLRYRYALSGDRERPYKLVIEYLDGPCSVLEMMVALAIRCEETIMDDPLKGDRTRQWFWGMIKNLGLGSMTDDRFDWQYVSDTVNRFLDRDYEPDGRGGLFTVKHCKYDLRDVEIWCQLNWYLNTII